VDSLLGFSIPDAFSLERVFLLFRSSLTRRLCRREKQEQRRLNTNQSSAYAKYEQTSLNEYHALVTNIKLYRHRLVTFTYRLPDQRVVE
jgi:hypothetical protein